MFDDCTNIPSAEEQSLDEVRRDMSDATPRGSSHSMKDTVHKCNYIPTSDHPVMTFPPCIFGPRSEG